MTIDYVMSELGFTKREIAEKKRYINSMKDWTAITFKELSEMNAKQLEGLKSVCWKDGEYRCSTVGIQDVNLTIVNTTVVSAQWSDSDGDPRLYNYELTDKINNIGEGDWNYGLYKKKS